MSRIKLLLAGMAVSLGVMIPSPAFAIDLNANICKDLPDSDSCNKTVKDENKLGTNNNIVQRVLGQVFLLLGGVATIMIIIGGVRYVFSQGDSGKVQSAKNTIMYAVIGLIVALMSYAIVAYISSKI